MVQVQVKLKEALAVNLSIIDMFRSTTVSGLARHLHALSDEKRTGDSSERSGTKRSDRRKRLVNRNRRDSRRRDRRPAKHD